MLQKLPPQNGPDYHKDIFTRCERINDNYGRGRVSRLTRDTGKTENQTGTVLIRLQYGKQLLKYRVSNGVLYFRGRQSKLSRPFQVRP